MGYNTDFFGEITIEPALSAEEVKFFNSWAQTRRMKRAKGDYHISPDNFGQSHDDDIEDYNSSGDMPSLWCNLEVTEDGTALRWNENEKTYELEHWIKWVIEHFFGSDPLARQELEFIQPHTLNGEMEANGDESDDQWKIIVENNNVYTARGYVEYGERESV